MGWPTFKWNRYLKYFHGAAIRVMKGYKIMPNVKLFSLRKRLGGDITDNTHQIFGWISCGRRIRFILCEPKGYKASYGDGEHRHFRLNIDKYTNCSNIELWFLVTPPWKVWKERKNSESGYCWWDLRMRRQVRLIYM